MPVTPVIASEPSAEVDPTKEEIDNGTMKALTSKKMPEYKILWWTRPPPSAVPETINRVDAPQFQPELPFSIGDCGLPYTCSFTDDRTILSTQGSIVLFRGSILEANDLPPLRPTNGGDAKDNHAWVLNTGKEKLTWKDKGRDVLAIHYQRVDWTKSFLTLLHFCIWIALLVLESSGSMDGLGNATMPLFTHSWSHSFESDIVQTTFDTQGAPRQQGSHNPSKRDDGGESNFLSSILTPPKVDLKEKNRLRALSRDQGGKAAVAWVLGPNEERGTTGSESRENYMRELLKLIDVDIYGATPLNNTIWPGTPSVDGTVVPVSSREIMADYKFVLAMESVHCQDFVSTTLADALLVGAVPIVDGPKDYSRFSPTVIQTSAGAVLVVPDATSNSSSASVDTSTRARESLVRLDEFLAPELLVQELLAMDQNDTLYLERLAYRDASKDLISPLFKDTFGEEGHVNSAVLDSSTTTTTTKVDAIPSWMPSQQGALCKICEMAQQLAENTYDWTSLARTRRIGEKDVKEAATDTRWISAQDLLKTLNAAGTGDACEPEPKYLPGLPDQMQAYDAFLQKQHEAQTPPARLEVDQELKQEPEPSITTSTPSSDKDSADPASSSKITSHSVDVTVSFDPTDAPPASPEEQLDQDPSLPNTWIQPGELSGNLPSVIIHHQEHVQPLLPASSSSTPSSSSLLPLPPSSVDQDKSLLFEQSSLTSVAGASPPPFEMYYLLLLILALGVGALALLLMTSKRARTLVLWPWRHLFYKKVATIDQEDPYPQDRLLQRNRQRRQDDRNQVTQSLERIMLQELGEDLLYE